ncbi:MAG: cytochrome c [Sphingobacteriales bacterium]|nr:MAG: cytochrome c [Sphingobacteriales bacterium]
MKTMKNFPLKATALVFAGTALLSCGRDANDPGLEYAPDMYHSKAYEPLREIEKNEFNYREGGTNMRYPVAGTIARGKMAYYTHISKDSVEIAATRLQNPLVRNEKNLAEGKVLYTRFCQPCHGAEGKGDGLVGQKYKGVANFTAGNIKNVSQGHIWHVITNGKGRMYPHGSQVNPEERWKIAMYVATLQDPEAAAAAAAAGTSATTGEPAGTAEVNTNQVTGTSTDPTKDTQN